MVTSCSEPLNRPLIALSRAMYGFFKDPGKGEPERVHEYEERRAKRLRFTESFQAGSICGELLLSALGMDMVDGNRSREREFPWVWRMLEWGYPPGWVSEEDPKLKVLTRINGEGMWTDDLDATIIFDNPPQPLNASITKCVDAEAGKAIRLVAQTNSQKRWVHYPTTLFSSEHLAVYTGTPMPPVTHTASWFAPVTVYNEDEDEDVVPPWRRPGAFSAFGPAGWQKYLNSPI